MEQESPEIAKRGKRRALEYYPHLEDKVKHFDTWLKAVEEWLKWIDDSIPENAHISRTEALDDFHMTPLGLRLLENLNVDIYPNGRDAKHTEYDLKKLLRAVVAFPTIARLTGKRLERKHDDIDTIFKEVINDTLRGDEKS